MMKENDIAVNLSALDSGGRKLAKKTDELERFADQLMRNLVTAGKEFDSANYERALKTVQEVMRKLQTASQRLRDGCKFLNEIEKLAENYLRCKYMG